MENTNLNQTKSEKIINVLLCSIIPDADLEDECNIALSELELLARTSIGDEHEQSSFYRLTQVRPSPDSATYLGQGKAQTAAEMCLNYDISLVIINSELSPSQIRNLENLINDYTKENKVTVIDRTMLILDIFAKHAVTGEGKVQVEIAQLKYTAPRLVGKGKDLSRQGGSIGTRGPGETKLETDKRHIQRRILSLKNTLKEMEGERATKRAKRDKSSVSSAVIVGYTNAGKSTLLNYLTDAGILAQDKLFATLDPTVRKLTLPSGRNITLSDTVGFISNLPHGLIESFKSTIEEVKYADIILVVADASDELLSEKIKVTEQTISQFEGAEIPKIYVLNKCDKADVLPQNITENPENVVFISAKTGKGIDNLLEVIDRELSKTKKEVTFLFPFDMQGAVNSIYQNCTVISVEYTESGSLVKAYADQKTLGQYKEYIIEK